MLGTLSRLASLEQQFPTRVILPLNSLPLTRDVWPGLETFLVVTSSRKVYLVGRTQDCC